MGIIPDSGVVLVHYCDDSAERASCAVCHLVTPELAAVHAVQAAAAAGVEHDPAALWAEVRQAVHEQLEWRRTVAGLAAGELVPEPERTRVLQHAGAAAWSRAAVDQATDRITLPPGWREHTATDLPAVTSPAGESRRQAWTRTLVLLTAFMLMIAGATAYVVITRPDGHAQVESTPNPGVLPPAVELADDNGDQADAEAGGQAGGDPDARHRSPTPAEPAVTPSFPPTMPPPAPTHAPQPPTGQVGGRTSVAPAPPSSSPSSSPTPSPTGAVPSPTGAVPSLPVPTPSVVVPVPSIAVPGG